MATEDASLKGRAIDTTAEFLALFVGALLGVLALGYLFIPRMGTQVLLLVGVIVAVTAVVGAMLVRWATFSVWRD